MNDTPKTSEAAGTPTHDWESVAERLFECSQALERENTRLRAALTELVAVVRGECPSLLNEDSGGDGTLSVEIDGLLANKADMASGKP